jgi:hypothetical protein
VAQFNPPVVQFCGAGPENVGVFLSGDASDGLWSAPLGTFSSTKSALTQYRWTAPGIVLLTFTPSSVCIESASLTVQIAPLCPPPPLSAETVAEIAVGATIGGLILIAVGIVAAIIANRAWNRNRVKLRDIDASEMEKPDYYKF